MSRYDHERILSTYGCAFFRNAVRGEPTFGYLDHTVLPAGVLNQNIHLSCEMANARTVDNYEGHPITQDNEGQATAQPRGSRSRKSPSTLSRSRPNTAMSLRACTCSAHRVP